jgi:hypothetical protein
MKSKDIKPGVVYGYRQGKYGSVEPVVFLAKPGPDQIYACPHRVKDGEPIHSHSRHATTPLTGRGFSSTDYGYAAVFAFGKPTAEVVDEMARATLDDFLAATKGYDAERGIRYSVVTVPARVVGPYDEAVAEEERRREAENRRWAEERGRREVAIQRAERLIEALQQHGIGGRPEPYSEPTFLEIPLDDVEKLLALLAEPCAGQLGDKP